MSYDCYSNEPTPAESEIIPDLGWCPECGIEPTSAFQHIQYCYTHQPDRSGNMDKVIDSEVYLTGSGEAGGSENISACNTIHRGE